jgi:hypothetical protein
MMDDLEQKITSEYSGKFDITNQSLMKPFNEAFYREFAAKILAKDNTCPHVDNACLAGAYLHVFCSAEFEEKGDSFRERLNEKDSEQYSFEPHLRFLMLCRVSELVDAVLKAIRNLEGAESEVAYAAAILLCHETNFFGSSIKYGTTYNHVGLYHPMLNRTLANSYRFAKTSETFWEDGSCRYHANWVTMCVRAVRDMGDGTVSLLAH